MAEYFDYGVFEKILHNDKFDPTQPLNIRHIIALYYPERYRGRIYAEIRAKCNKLLDKNRLAIFRGTPPIKLSGVVGHEANYYELVVKYYFDNISGPKLTIMEILLCLLVAILWPIFIIINLFVARNLSYLQKKWGLWKREFQISALGGPFTTYYIYKLKNFFPE